LPFIPSREVTSLYLDRQDISEISEIVGLSSCTGITRLDLRGNKLRSLDGLDGLTQLEFLYVNHNLLSSIPDLKNMKALKALIMSGNKLESLRGIDRFAELVYARLDRNKITSIDSEELDHLENLQYLDLSDNHLREIPILKKLTSHDKFIYRIGGNLIKDLDDGAVDFLKKFREAEDPILRESIDWTDEEILNYILDMHPTVKKMLDVSFHGYVISAYGHKPDKMIDTGFLPDTCRERLGLVPLEHVRRWRRLNEDARDIRHPDDEEI